MEAGQDSDGRVGGLEEMCTLHAVVMLCGGRAPATGGQTGPDPARGVGVWECVCLLLQYLLQSCSRGGGGEWRTCATRDDCVFITAVPSSTMLFRIMNLS